MIANEYILMCIFSFYLNLHIDQKTKIRNSMVVITVEKTTKDEYIVTAKIVGRKLEQEQVEELYRLFHD
jgi:hypothetical protein